MQPSWERIWGFRKKLKIELPYDRAILLLGICLYKTIIKKKIRVPLCIAALFTIAKTWKQPTCPSNDEWIKMWYIYTIEYYSAIKKNEIMLFAATWVDSEIVILSERQIPYDITCTWHLKYDTNELTYKTETDSENRL